MKFWIKLPFSLAILLFLFVLSSVSSGSQTRAEGTCTCDWIGSPGGFVCKVIDTCPTGWVATGCAAAGDKDSCESTTASPCTCVAPSPTLAPPTPPPDCGSCITGDNCNFGCSPSSSPGINCSCKPDLGSLSCNQTCDPLSLVKQCPDGCGNCQIPLGATGLDFRCVNSTGGIEPDPPSDIEIPPYDPCEGMGPQEGACRSCIGDPPTGETAWTGLGCISVAPTDFAATIIQLLFGIAGGVAFLLIIYGAFICVTSKGDPTRAQACKETITAAIVGLLMLIFALAIVRIIFGPTSSSLFPGLVNIF